MVRRRERQRKYRILAKTLPEGVLITDTQGILTYVNPALEDMFGIPSAVSLGTHFRNYITPESLPDAEKAFVGCAQGKTVREVELQAVHQDGHVFPIEIVASPILKVGAFQGVESVVRDITARKQAEEALRRSERQFRSTFENAAIGIAYVALDGRIAQANSRFGEITGYSSGKVLGKTCEEITLTEDWEVERESLQRLLEGKVAHYSIEKRYLRPDGNPVWVHLTRSMQRDEAGRPDCFIILAEDISDRKRAEEALRQSENRYRKLFEASLAGAYLTKLDGTILDCNEAMMRMLGYDTREEVFAHRSTDFYADPEFRKELLYLLQRDGIVPAREAVLRRKDGSILHALGHAVLLKNEQTGEPYIQGVAIDITERKQVEEALRELTRTLESKVADRTAELQHRARQLEKMALELSEAEDRERRRLAVILHDDLQQELAAARFQVERMRNQARYDVSLQATAAQADHLLKDAIAKSRSLSHELSPAVMHHGDFAEMLRWLANEMQAKYGLGVRVKVDREVRSESEAIKSLLFRAAQELLFNVVKYAQVREARLRVRPCERCICLSVSDRGRGFDPQRLENTAGFGLLSIRERVELLRGRMKIRSAAGRGSTFFIAVPRSEQAAAPPPAGVEVTRPEAAEPRAEEHARLRILLADDHEITRQGLLALLRDEHSVEVVAEAANGHEAVALANRLEPDVVVMDVSMPLMGGDEATRQIKAHRPQTRVIALSMYDEPGMMEQMYQAGAESYVIKTAPTEELLAAIRGEKPDSEPVASSR
jgi:PAS domain S-box-containing protein